MTVLSSKLWTFLFVILCVFSVLIMMPIIAGAQSVVETPDDGIDSRAGLLFFSMKPVVIGEGTQTVRISSKRWKQDSIISIDASPECTDTYGMTFETPLPIETVASEKYGIYPGSTVNGWRTDYPLLITPGTVATGISEQNSECKIILSDGEYTLKRPLRQIVSADKNVMTFEVGPELNVDKDIIHGENLGHPPGVWFLSDEGFIDQITRARLASSSEYSRSTSRPVYNSHGHPESIYAGGVPDEWIEDKRHFCISYVYSIVGVKSYPGSPETCYNGEGQPAPIPVPTKTPLVLVYDAWCNLVQNGVTWPNIEEKNGNYVFTLKYNCSETGYEVSHKNLPSGVTEFTWNDSSLPAGVNGTVYNAPLGDGYVSTPTATAPPVAAPPVAAPIEGKPEEKPTPTPTATPTATPTPTAAPIEGRPEDKLTSTPTVTPTATPTPTSGQRDPNDPEMKCPHRNDGKPWDEDCSNFPVPPYRWWWE